MRAAVTTCVFLMLGACTTTYGPDDPPGDQGDVEAPVCAEDDTRAGCRSENPACLDPHDYLCTFPD